MENIIQILESLESISSRTEKENILKKNINNEKLKQLFIYAMNPFYIYGIGVKTFNDDNGVNRFTDITELLDYLRANPTGQDSTKRAVNSFVNAQPIGHRDWLKRVILKDLRIGVTAKTINKIYGNIIPVFDVMLAKPFDRLFDVVNCEPKIDGVRAIAVKQNGVVHLFTRNGNLIQGYNSIENDIEALDIDNIILDGEIISGDYTGTMNKLFSKADNKMGIYNIFDILTVDEFYSGKSKDVYTIRKKYLSEISQITTSNILNFMIHGDTLYKPTVEDLAIITDKVVGQGYEGIMIKNTEGLYECKRSINWQKLKPFFTEEFEVIGFESGTGKYDGILGKVIIDVNGVSVGLGSGFSDQQRIDIWDNQEEYLGAFVEVQYQEKIEKTGALRFPTFKGFRNLYE